MTGSLRAWVQGVEWTGYDGAENIELATEDVHFADLTVPQWFGHKYDWVLSLEVRSSEPRMQLGHTRVHNTGPHLLRNCAT